jgi:hypothetical protein
MSKICQEHIGGKKIVDENKQMPASLKHKKKRQKEKEKKKHKNQFHMELRKM